MRSRFVALFLLPLATGCFDPPEVASPVAVVGYLPQPVAPKTFTRVTTGIDSWCQPAVTDGHGNLLTSFVRTGTPEVAFYATPKGDGGYADPFSDLTGWAFGVDSGFIVIGSYYSTAQADALGPQTQPLAHRDEVGNEYRDAAMGPDGPLLLENVHGQGASHTAVRSLGRDLHERWTQSLPRSFSLQVDQAGNALVVGDDDGGTRVLHWVDASGHVGPEFPDDEVMPPVSGATIWPVEDFIGMVGGAARGHPGSDGGWQWDGWIDSLSAHREAAPAWLASRHVRNVAIIEGGKAYAFFDEPGADAGGPSFEVVDRSGVSLGRVSLDVPATNPRGSLTVGADGSLIMSGQTIWSVNHTTPVCVWTVWPQVLR